MYLRSVAEVERRDLRLVRSDLEHVDQVGDEALNGEESVVASAAGRVQYDGQVQLTTARCVSTTPLISSHPISIICLEWLCSDWSQPRRTGSDPVCRGCDQSQHTQFGRNEVSCLYK